MSAACKSENPAATGFNADQTNFTAIVASTVARLQLAGFGVHRTESGWLVCRWGMSKLCADLAELRAFAKKTGAL